MKMHTLKAAAFAAASFGWIAVAAAQGHEGGPMRRPGGPGGPGFGPGGPPPMERLTEELGLTDDQKAQWKAIHDKARETGEPLMKAAGNAHQAFDKALDADNADAATVGQAAIAMKNAERKLDAHHKATLEETKAILTPEQAARLEQFEKRMRRPGPGQPGPGGPGGPAGRRGPGPGAK